MQIGPKDDGYDAGFFAPVKDRDFIAFPLGVNLLSRESQEILARVKAKADAAAARFIKRRP